MRAESIGESVGSEEEEVSSDEYSSWISWFCSLPGNEFFVEVDDVWIEDDFNLHGLAQQVPNYDYALDTILDRDSDIQVSDQQAQMIQHSAEILYGLIHARYIITARGLEQMYEKYTAGVFGRCPRVFCESQLMLPVGQTDIPGQTLVKLFCLRCQDLYYPKAIHASCTDIDGAYFGTTFPHLFPHIFPECLPSPPKHTYVPRVFGFKVHKTSHQVLKSMKNKPQ